MLSWMLFCPLASSSPHSTSSKWHSTFSSSFSHSFHVTSVHLRRRHRVSQVSKLALYLLYWLLLMQLATLVIASSLVTFNAGQASPLTQDSIIIDDGASVGTSTASLDDGEYPFLFLLFLLSSSFSPPVITKYGPERGHN